MSDGPQPGFPFGFGQFDLAEIMRQLQSEGPLNFDVARQVATWVAGQHAEGAPEAPVVDPEGAPELSELTRLAHMHVLDATGLGAGLEGRARKLSRPDWAGEALDDLGPVLTTLAERLTGPPDADGAGLPDPQGADLMGLMNAMAPLLLGMQAGFMVGHLATLSLGRYEMPLPLDGTPRVSVVEENLVRFGNDWELPLDELGLYVAVHETVHAALHAVPWVHERFLAEATSFVAAFEVDPSVVEDRLGALNPMDPSAMEDAFGDPAAFLGALRSPRQQEAQARLGTTTALLEGFADAVLAHVGSGLIPSFERIREASHRHRVERGEAARFLEMLLGFDVGRDAYDEAGAFWAGVVERAGVDGLRMMWTHAERFPTPNELAAPGLWLERIQLPGDDPSDVVPPE